MGSTTSLTQKRDPDPMTDSVVTIASGHSISDLEVGKTVRMTVKGKTEDYEIISVLDGNQFIIKDWGHGDPPAEHLFLTPAERALDTMIRAEFA